MFEILIPAAVIFLAYVTGANAIIKGVASLLGSGTAGYRTTMVWGAATAAAGSMAAMFLAAEMMKKFSGRGLVSDLVAQDPFFMLSVALGASLTVLTATLLGFPVSTTHSLIGSLVGAGFAAEGVAVNLAKLWENFARPLVISPVLAVVTGGAIYLLLRLLRLAPDHRTRTLDTLHFLSAGAVCFARGLNDTPKLAAAMLVLSTYKQSPWLSLALVAVFMTVGGLISARRVAVTLAFKITGMNPGQAFSANLATSLLVTTASLHGLPVSTTHVSVGSLLGIGITTHQAKWHTVIPVLLAWVCTVPCGAALGGCCYWMATRLIN